MIGWDRCVRKRRHGLRHKLRPVARKAMYRVLQMLLVGQGSNAREVLTAREAVIVWSPSKMTVHGVLLPRHRLASALGAGGRKGQHPDRLVSRRPVTRPVTIFHLLLLSRPGEGERGRGREIMVVWKKRKQLLPGMQSGAEQGKERERAREREREREAHMAVRARRSQGVHLMSQWARTSQLRRSQC
jgi:hypothetical protein